MSNHATWWRMVLILLHSTGCWQRRPQHCDAAYASRLTASFTSPFLGGGGYGARGTRLLCVAAERPPLCKLPLGGAGGCAGFGPRRHHNRGSIQVLPASPRRTLMLGSEAGSDSAAPRRYVGGDEVPDRRVDGAFPAPPEPPLSPVSAGGYRGAFSRRRSSDRPGGVASVRQGRIDRQRGIQPPAQQRSPRQRGHRQARKDRQTGKTPRPWCRWHQRPPGAEGAVRERGGGGISAHSVTGRQGKAERLGCLWLWGRSAAGK
jgi:hypothetical protein